MRGGGLESHLLLHVHITIISMSFSIAALGVGTGAERECICVHSVVSSAGFREVGLVQDSNKRSEMSCIVL
jgi:hypothetical protein